MATIKTGLAKTKPDEFYFSLQYLNDLLFALVELSLVYLY